MTTSAEQIRAFTGPALLSYGFRPFFLFGALWAAIAIAVWLPMLSSHLLLPSAFTPIEWHVHELVYGYVPAIIAGNNTRNLKVLAVLVFLLIGNVLFHLEAIAGIGNAHGTRLGIAAIVMLIMLIGGRIIPSFTRNWLARRDPGRLPAPFDRFDLTAMAVSGVALATWVILPDKTLTAVLALAAWGLNLVRCSRWAGERTAAEPLLLILHVAYAFVPLGFLLLALGILTPGLVAQSGALHGWTAGAIALMTLAVMTRASLSKRAAFMARYKDRRLSLSLWTISVGLNRRSREFGVKRYSTAVLPAWLTAISRYREAAAILGEDQATRIPPLLHRSRAGSCRWRKQPSVAFTSHRRLPAGVALRVPF